MATWKPKSPLSLTSYQKDALAYLWEQKKKGLTWGALFMEMRLGKTLVMVRWLKTLDVKKVLIVTPYSVMDTWRRALLEDGVQFSEIAFVTGEGKNRPARLKELTKEDARYFIVNFEAVANLELAKFGPWPAVVIDESYRIANPKTGVTKYLLKHFTQKNGTTHRYILSGAPAPEKELNYITQLIWLRGSLFGHTTYWSYSNANCNRSEFKEELKPASKATLQSLIQNSCFVLSRKKAGVGPQKVYIAHKVKMGYETKLAYNLMRTKWEADGVQVTTELARASALARIASGFVLESPDDPPRKKEAYRLREMPYEKMDALLKITSEQLRESQVLIWCRLIDEIFAVRDALASIGINAPLIWGDVPVHEREQIRQEFQAGFHRVCIMQVQTGKVGLDFSAADTAIYFSNALDADSRIQSEDRVCHLRKTGQTVLIIDLVTSSSIEEVVVDLLVNKQVKSQMFLNSLYRLV